MSDPTFMADPTRLVIAAIVGIALLLALIIKFKLHPVLSMMVSALAIGIGAARPGGGHCHQGRGNHAAKHRPAHWPRLDVWPDS